METPRTLKAALSRGYVICKLYAKRNKIMRVTLKERFHEAERKMLLEFWIDRDYFKRNYPNEYDRL